MVVKITNSARGTPYYEQHYIYGGLNGGSCSENVANTMIRMTSRPILSWIHKHTDSGPVLMVMGGSNNDSRFLNSVEIISGSHFHKP